MQLVFQFPQTYFATKMNSETLEILFSFLAISMATFFDSKSFHNLTFSYFFQPLYNNHVTSAGYSNGQKLCLSATSIKQRVKGLANYLQAEVKSFWS